MKSQSLMLLAVASGCGLVAMLGVQRVLSGSRSGEQMVPVLVAKSEIDIGVKLDETNVGFKNMPISAVPPGAITKKDEYEDRALKVQAYAGQPIPLQQLGEKGIFGATISIPPGMRVVTIPVNATLTHSGLMKPGDRVDVMLSYRVSLPNRGQVTRTKTILEYIEVYATDQRRIGAEDVKSDSQSKNVSLLVTPDQAMLLKHAEAKESGGLQLALRSKLDTSPTDVKDLDDDRLDAMQALFDDPPAQEVTPAPVPEPVAPQPAPVVETAERKPSFTEFLQNRFAAAASATEVVPEKKTWKVAIYSGADVVVQEYSEDGPVEPVPVVAPSPSASLEPVETGKLNVDKASVEAAKSFVRGLLSAPSSKGGTRIGQEALKIQVP